MYSKISYTIYWYCNKMAYANNADPDQSAPEVGLIRAYIVRHFIKYFVKQMQNKNIGETDGCSPKCASPIAA